MLNPVSRRIFSRWFGAAALLSLSTLSTLGQYDPDWARNFRLGLLTGFNIKGSFRMSGDFSLSGRGPGEMDVHGQNHFFDDGYVRVDNTGNAGGYTTYWGYQNSSQIVGNELHFTSTDSFNTTASASADSEEPSLGLDLAYGGVLWRGERMRVGWEFGFGLLPITLKDDSQLSGTKTTSTYAFQIPDDVVVPGAPYNGSPSGYDQPGLSDLGTRTGDPVTENISITGTRELDVILYAFRLGPSVFFDLHPRVGFAVSGGPALGFISGDYRYNERVDGVENRGSFGVSDLVYGGYVNATLTYHATLNGDFYISAQYMPLGSAEFSQGGRSAKLDLSGAIYLSGGINWPF